MNRPDILHGKTKRVRTGCGNLYVTINEKDGQPYETFIRLGKAGGCASSQTEALGRLITIILRNHVPLSEIIDQLQGIGCHQPAFVGEGNRNLSCADAVAKILKNFDKQENPSVVSKEQEELPAMPEKQEKLKTSKKFWDKMDNTACPECGARLAYEEGCQKCFACGYTKC